MDRRAALRAAGRDVGSRAGALADAEDRRWRRVRPRGRARLRRLEPQITWGTDPSMVLGISGRVPDPSAAADQGRKRRDRKRARLHGTYPRHGARRPAGEPGVHRLLHQRPAAGPAGRRRHRARAARRRRRDRHGGAGLVDGEARGGGRGPRPGVPRRRLLLGRVRLLDVRRRQRRPRRAGRAHASRPPTAISSTARARRCARIWSARRRRRRPRSPAASPTCGRCRGAPDAAVHQPHRHRRPAAARTTSTPTRSRRCRRCATSSPTTRSCCSCAPRDRGVRTSCSTSRSSAIPASW